MVVEQSISSVAGQARRWWGGGGSSGYVTELWEPSRFGWPGLNAQELTGFFRALRTRSNPGHPTEDGLPEEFEIKALARLDQRRPPLSRTVGGASPHAVHLLPYVFDGDVADCDQTLSVEGAHGPVVPSCPWSESVSARSVLATL